MDTKAKILDIAMNLNRIGNFAADGYQLKRRRIEIFLNQTNHYLKLLKETQFPESFKSTYRLFLKEYDKLLNLPIKSRQDEQFWAEKMMTWGNILTHRAKLI